MELLIVGTLEGQIGAASKIAIQQGGHVSIADNEEAGLDVLRSGKAIELVMIDVKLDVYKFISSLEQERINVLVVACGVANDPSLAVKAIKAGAKEYIPLPPDPEMIGAVLAAATRENHALIYGDKKTEAVLKLAKQVAPSEANILLTGQSGTGKEVFSRFIHDNSKRANKKFVAVNCAAIPETLLESELFGYEKGAFTGAVARRIGKFEEASGGTLLLDEISETDVKIQAKLLRAIQEKEIDRIGGKAPIKVDTRIIATSNRNLDECVKNGTFRQDLYYRLNVVNINIPPLKDRPDDIIVLAKHFAKKYSELNDIPLKEMTPAAEQKLLNYLWPGNVRELENTVHRAVLLSTGDKIDEDAILLDDIDAVINPAAGTEMSGAEFVGSTVASMERNLIIDTLKHTMGNRTTAANILGISIRTLRNKLKQYQDEGFEVPGL
ncbi:MAG TPA: sigma-54-dependent Fis family transcriptional regulator [Candidatus Scatocola faecipullorum]|uniref:Sigma-54-dependent Fis family transcriptional regulator n=1 Tax=Candidatus Scatocola faecipullorum TaxID=2840917 RepID=A0A9D1M5D7_9PROT|nr:sigma-54-dependent Fis family transcriptional regulator [Candidatus Scatocola faecipullorum]